MGKFPLPRHEARAVAGLSSVLMLRMLGLSMLIPVFSVYAVSLPEATPLLAGIAFGVYGLTQAILQVPFGFFSDRFGRKPVVAGGLLVFALSSVVAATTDDIYVLIAARFLQGAGAIASACFAWIADLTDDSRRNIAMAFLGISVGSGIVLGMIVGPVIGGTMGVPFLFWLAAGFSVVAIGVTVFLLKEPDRGHLHAGFALNPKVMLAHALKPDLLRLDAAGMLVNAAMIAVFFAVPIRLAEKFAMTELWKIYLPLAFFGAAAMMTASRRADRGAGAKVIAGSLAAVGVSCLVFTQDQSIYVTLAAFTLFFSAFSVLEATLPAGVSRLADPTHKGGVIGVYNFSQFMGTFLGGTAAGAFGTTHPAAFFVVLSVLLLGGAALAAGVEGLAAE